jgi:hypothetical protein
MTVLDEQRAAALEALCELIVPGSARVGPVVYIDAVLVRMPAPVQENALASIDALSPPSAETLVANERTPEFAFVRALAIEAFYSDFVEPGRDVEGAWAEIGFDPPAARRLRKDWSYLGVA